MSDPSLLQQLLSRVTVFKANFPNITQADIARHIGVRESNFSAALAGRVGFSDDSVLRLHKLFNLSKREVLAKFCQPVRTSKILCLQESVQGQPARMRLHNSGWYPSEDSSGGVDPLNSTGIDNTPSADTTGPVWDQDLIDVLREARGYHRAIVRSINSYIAKAKVNAGITVPTGVSQKFSRRS
jgi:hypothetical protein